MAKVGALIGEALDHAADDAHLARLRDAVHELAHAFPLYASRLRS
jgi:glycine hydroxymethyltransferase